MVSDRVGNTHHIAAPLGFLGAGGDEFLKTIIP